MTSAIDSLKIAIVGPCGAGKTTLRNNLQELGIPSRALVQEHSYVLDMWKRLTNPDVLIFLDVTYEETIRRKKLSWLPGEYETQVKRLAHARQNCDLYIPTDPYTPVEIVHMVIDFLRQKGLLI